MHEISTENLFPKFLKKIRLLINHFKHFCVGVQRFLFQNFSQLALVQAYCIAFSQAGKQ